MSKEQQAKEHPIEIRSEEVQEIMGYIPRWIIRWGITVIFLTIFVLLIGSWFFKYPDIIASPITVTTQNPPVGIKARANGKIQQLFAKDNQQVKRGDVISIIENPADYNHVFKLKKQLADLLVIFSNFEPSNFNTFDKNYSLGEIQSSYEVFFKSYENYKHFVKLDFHQKKIESLAKQIKNHNELLEQLINQKNLLQKDYDSGKNQFERAKVLFNEGVISQHEFETSKSKFLQKEHAVDGAKNSLINTRIRINELKQSILELDISFQQKKKELQLQIKQTYDNLSSQIAHWEHNYLLKTPIEGKITFNNYWSPNQNVNIGECVFTVVPNESSQIIGKLMLPIQGSGKVKVGQKVNIKFSNYPHLEYGMVRGIIKSKSLVPLDEAYLVEVGLPQGLKTNYGNTLVFSQQMQGSSEIITKDIRLLERIFHPIKSIFKKHVDQ